jgi:hypothetical protein
MTQRASCSYYYISRKAMFIIGIGIDQQLHDLGHQHPGHQIKPISVPSLVDVETRFTLDTIVSLDWAGRLGRLRLVHRRDTLLCLVLLIV